MQRIQESISNQGEIPFVDYMQMALYTPQEGYYSSGRHKLGKQGDFTTAPELSTLFGKSVANQCRQVLATLKEPVILEYGAGTGRLCVDILKQLEAWQALPKHYYILEVSADLRFRQQELIKQALPQLVGLVQWLDSWPAQPLEAVILANEVLDAMPVHRFLQHDGAILESYVGLDENGGLCERFKPCSNQRLIDHIRAVLPADYSPYLSEVNLFLDDWIQQNAQCLQKGAMILIDYGFPRHEYYHPDRNQGTLMCHYQHKAQPNPLLHPGEQDITAHVDFTHVAEAGHKAGFAIAGYTNQASFLLSNGLLSFMQELTEEKDLFTAKQAIKQLTQPSEMGELFKVIALTKNLDLDLVGFQLHDKRASL